MTLLPRFSQNTKSKTGGCEEVIYFGKRSQETGGEDWEELNKDGEKVKSRVYDRADPHCDSPDFTPLRTPRESPAWGRKTGICTHWLPSLTDQGLPQGPDISRCLATSEWLIRRLPRSSSSKVPGQILGNTLHTI